MGKLDLKAKKLKTVKMKEGPQKRIGSRVVRFSEDLIYLVGGFTCNVGYLMDVWKFSTVSERWSKVEMQSVRKVSPIGRLGHSITLRKQVGFMVGGMRNQIILNDIWTMHFQQKIWEPLKIFNENVVPLYGHMSAHVEHGPCEGNIIIFGGLTQQSQKIEQLENIVVEKLHNGSLYMLDFQSFREINDKDKEQTGVEYVVEFKEIQIHGQIEPKCFGEVVAVNDYFYILGGGRSQYFIKLGYTQTDDQELGLYQKGFERIIKQNELEKFQQKIQSTYGAQIVQKSTYQQAKEIINNLLGADDKKTQSNNNQNPKDIAKQQQDDAKSKNNRSIKSGKLDELLSKSANKSKTSKKTYSKRSVKPTKVIDEYTKNEIEKIEEQLEELQNNDKQIFVTDNSQEENDKKLNKNKVMMQYWNDAKDQVNRENNKK